MINQLNYFRLLVNLPTASSISFKVNKTGEMRVFNSTDRELHNLWPATYSVSVGNTTIQSISLQLGGVYTLVLGAVNGKPVRILKRFHWNFFSNPIYLFFRILKCTRLQVQIQFICVSSIFGTFLIEDNNSICLIFIV